MRKYLAILFPIIILLYSCCFIIQEGQRGILLRFGKVLRDINHNTVILLPGLHFKNPLIETVKSLDARIQTLENQTDRFVTKEKKDLIVDSYIKWRITDFNRFYVSTGGGDITKVENFLRKTFSDRLRSEIGRLNVKDIVTDSRGKLTSILHQKLNESLINTHFIGTNITKNLLGIQVVDVRIKQINLPPEVSDAIYKRMRAERDADARLHRSKGKEEAEKIRAAADYEVISILAESERQAHIIHGEADAFVAKLFSIYFNQDTKFYSFVRTLHAYKKIFQSNKDLMILDINHPFLRYMIPSFTKNIKKRITT
ncbi:MAG: protease modulator HflC [Candidatus Dasytiphilus stammeri]